MQVLYLVVHAREPVPVGPEGVPAGSDDLELLVGDPPDQHCAQCIVERSLVSLGKLALTQDRQATLLGKEAQVLVVEKFVRAFEDGVHDTVRECQGQVQAHDQGQCPAPRPVRHDSLLRLP